MAKDFYKEWFDIPEQFRPVTHYQLLGLKSFETSPEKIDKAMRDRMRIVQKYQVGKYADASVQIMMELSMARAKLLIEAQTAQGDSSPNTDVERPGPVLQEIEFSEQILDPLHAGPPTRQQMGPTRTEAFRNMVEVVLYQTKASGKYLAMLEAEARHFGVATHTAKQIIAAVIEKRDQGAPPMPLAASMLPAGWDTASSQGPLFRYTWLNRAMGRLVTFAVKVLLVILIIGVLAVAVYWVPAKTGLLDSRLLTAAKNNDVTKAKVFVTWGADVNAQGEHGWTPLILAAQRNHKEMAQYLLESEADVNKQDDHGQGPLHWAAYKGHRKIAALLIANKADIDGVDQDGWTPLCWAASKGNHDLIRLLVASGASVCAESQTGWKPFVLALENGDATLLEPLLANGTDVNVRDSREKTMLHLAAERGSLSFVECLIDRGADVNAKDMQGRTPLDFAEHDREVSKLLREHGGKPGKRRE